MDENEPKQLIQTTVVDRAVNAALPNAPPNVQRAARVLLEPWAEKFVHILDDLIRIPGTKIGIGLDAILGFFLPGVGDLFTGLSAISMLFLAFKHRVPAVVMGRMIMNIGIDSLIGALPVVGDVFDVFFKSNRMNLELIEKFKRDPSAKPSTSDYAIVIAGVAIAAMLAILPLLLLVGIFGASIWAGATAAQSCQSN